MATITTNITDRSGLWAAVRRVLSSIWAGFVFVAEIGQLREELELLSRKSDDQLAAEGKTRHGEINRIFGPRMAL